MSKGKLTKEERLEQLLSERVHLPSGSATLYGLIMQGVTRCIIYYNNIECRTNSLINQFTVKRKIAGYGLEFSNGITLKNINKAVFDYATDGVEIVEKKERLNNYRLK